MTADLVVEPTDLNYHDAHQLTERIKLKVGTIQDSIEGLAALVQRAKNGNAWSVLGFASWTAYIADTIGADPLDLTRSERKKLTAFLASEGMSARAIAPVVGISKSQVAEDIADSTVQFPDSRPATVTSLDGRERPSTQPVAKVTETTKTETYVNTETGEVTAAPEPSTPRRRPLPDVARDAGWDLRKSVERLQRIAADDRFNSHKDQMAPHLRSHLTHAIEVCQDLLDRINN